MLDPGIYYIEQLHLTMIGTFNRFINGPGIKQISSNSHKYMVTIGAFEVKKNRISYLGHLKLTPDGNYGKLPFRQFNEIEKVKKDLTERGYMDLAENVVLERFYNAGSLIVKNKQKYELFGAKI